MRILVAGIGNIFFGDDGFGPAVAAQLVGQTWPANVEVADFGIRGMDLAFALTSGVDAAILVDAVARGGAPGTLYTIEPGQPSGPPELDNHAMDPVRVLAFAQTIGTLPARVRIVGCEPATLGDDGDGTDIRVGLSAPVAGAIAPAVEMVRELIAQLEAQCTS